MQFEQIIFASKADEAFRGRNFLLGHPFLAPKVNAFAKDCSGAVLRGVGVGSTNLVLGANSAGRSSCACLPVCEWECDSLAISGSAACHVCTSARKSLGN